MQLKDTERPACQYGEAVPSIKHGVRARANDTCGYEILITSEWRYVVVPP